MSSGHLKKFLVHTKNKHMDEGALRNVLFEIKDVIKPVNALIKQQQAAMTEASKWGQVLCASAASRQLMVPCSFLPQRNAGPEDGGLHVSRRDGARGE
jgi:hypothetical protein